MLSNRIVNDRSQGCGSVADGQIEAQPACLCDISFKCGLLTTMFFFGQVMLHRRLLHDDYRGVGEPLNETEAVRTVHRVTFGASNEGGRNLRTMAYHINNPPTLFFASSFNVPPFSFSFILSLSALLSSFGCIAE